MARGACATAEDRETLVYFGALDAFHETQGLESFKTFLQVQDLKTWSENVA